MHPMSGHSINGEAKALRVPILHPLVKDQGLFVAIITIILKAQQTSKLCINRLTQTIKVESV
jgi:hypothetical protein